MILKRSVEKAMGKETSALSNENNRTDEINVDKKFQKLTPEKDLGGKGLSGYKEALDYAFSDADIRNIALTGVYGSGKSSILESYKKKSELKYIHISLAHFDNLEAKKDEEKNNIEKFNEKTLEGKILNQLLHQIDSRDIPQTIFRTKKNVKKKSVGLFSAIVLVVIISILYVLNVEPWMIYIKELFSWLFGWLFSVFKLLPRPDKRIVDSIVVTTLIFSLGYLIYKVALIQLNRKIFKGFSFKSSGVQSDIEIFSESDVSYFDKYLDDVLYLFCQSGADIIVFEDIDRFENGIIFEKLKELNTLVNNKIVSRNVGVWGTDNNKHNQMKFLYLLKDDLFTSKDRAKFFDFIIPIVPVVTSTNSYEKLKELLESSGIYEKFDRNFLQKISLYIDDMRLMKNIYNEFLIYSKRIDLEKLKLSNEELLSILTYKNIFPDDFSCLLYNKGFVYALFKNKIKLIKEKEDELEEHIATLKGKIESGEYEYLSSLDELIYLYLPYTIRVNGVVASDYPSIEKFMETMRNPESTLQYMFQMNSWSSITFTEIQNSLKKNSDFQKRKKVLENRKNKEEIKEAIAEAKAEKDLIKNSKLKDILSVESIEDIANTDYQSLKRSEYFDLIVFLLRNGYINEGYTDYITYFYENSLRLADKNFLRSITDEKKLYWEYPLTKSDNVKEEIIDRMIRSDFLKVESLNFNLFEFLLLKSTNPNVDSYLSAYFQMIRSEKKVDFIMQAFLSFTDEGQNNLVLAIYDNSYSLFKTIFLNEQFSDAELSKLASKMLLSLNYDQLLEIDIHDEFFLEFLDNSSQIIFEINRIIDDDIIENLSNLGPCFISVDFSRINEDFSKLIFENNFYALNYDNILTILTHFYDVTDEWEIKHRNYTIISNLEDKTLLNYVNGNKIGEYVSAYLLFSEGEIDDEISQVYEIIKNDKLSHDKTGEYIRCLKTKDLNLQEITYLRAQLEAIKYQKAKANEKNIITCFLKIEEEYDNNTNESKGLENLDKLLDFIIDGSAEYSFDKDKAGEEFKNEELDDFLNWIVTKNEIPDERYNDIISKIDIVFSEFAFENIESSKIELLLDNHKIEFSETSLQTFREHYSEYNVRYILNNIDNYMDYVDIEENYDYDEMYEVLVQSDNLSIEKQKDLVDCFDSNDGISIQHISLKKELTAYILSTHFNYNDLEYICEVYDTQTNIIRIEIYKLVMEYFMNILEEDIKLSKELLKKLIQDMDVNLEDRRLIMSRNIEKIELEKLPELFSDLKLDELNTIFDGKNPSFTRDEVYKNILTYLKKKGVISSFSETNDMYRVYNKRKRTLIFEYLD